MYIALEQIALRGCGVSILLNSAHSLQHCILTGQISIMVGKNVNQLRKTFQQLMSLTWHHLIAQVMTFPERITLSRFFFFMLAGMGLVETTFNNSGELLLCRPGYSTFDEGANCLSPLHCCLQLCFVYGRMESSWVFLKVRCVFPNYKCCICLIRCSCPCRCPVSVWALPLSMNPVCERWMMQLKTIVVKHWDHL